MGNAGSASRILQKEFGLSTERATAFDALSVKQATLLAQGFAAARRHQEEALAAAIEEGFRHLPLLLRGPVRKILGA